MHKLQMYEDLRDMLEREVKEIEKKGDLDVQGLDNLYKLMTALKVTDKCIEREKGEQNGGMSGNSYNNSYGYGSSNDVSNANAYSMNRGYSRTMMPEYAMDGMSNDRSNDMGRSMDYSRDRSYDGRSNDGRSYDGMSNDGGMSNAGRRGRDGDGDGRYNESRDNFRDNSNRRGSYESYDGRSYEYSRDTSRKKMIQKLETLMDDTMSENERKAIMECIEKIK